MENLPNKTEIVHMNNLNNVCIRALKYSGYDIKHYTNTFENIDEIYRFLDY